VAATKGGLVVAQSGGPTTVINSSLCGVVQEAMNHDCFTDILAANNGVLGVLNEELFDIRKEEPGTVEALRRTPSAMAGSCRYKLKGMETSREDYERLLEVFKCHGVHYFIYIGGNDSMDTADKLGKLAADTGYELTVMGVPKTIDNDLAFTDHCPGFGSVAKFLCASVMEAGRDTESLYTADTTTVFETMGRNAGWIAAATGLAHRGKEDAPHLVYVPEVAFSVDRFVDDVKRTVDEIGRAFIVASEGLVDEKGNYVAEQAGQFGKDAFGHKQLGGVSETLKSIVEEKVGVKCRYCKPGTAQRNAMHFASLTDSNEAYMAGQAASRKAAEGTSGYMVTLVREEGEEYRCSTGLAKLSEVANAEKKLPRAYMNEAGIDITDEMRKYGRPLVRGEVPIEMGKDGLPVYARFVKHFVEKKCPAWSGGKK